MKKKQRVDEPYSPERTHNVLLSTSITMCSALHKFLLAIALLLTTSSCVSAQTAERETLELFYMTCNGMGWPKQDNWFTSESICLWEGIECDELGFVREIEMRDNNVECELPTKVFTELSSLAVLDLSENEGVSVTFLPLIGLDNVPPLKRLYLADCDVSSLEGLDVAFNETLVAFSASGASLNGPFPTEILQLTLLQQLDLSYNLLEGEIPDLSALSDLRALLLSNNMFSGSIPASMGALFRLNLLSLSFNQLSGSVPTELGQLRSLSSLSLDNQGGEDGVGGLTGPIPDFADNPVLLYLNLAHNQFSGNIPETFLEALPPDISRVLIVCLNDNMFTGAVPLTLARFDSIRIFLQNNLIETVPVELCEQSGWFFGEVGQFGCDAILCPPGTYGRFGRQISEDFPCQACSVGSQVFFGGTSCIEASILSPSSRSFANNTEAGVLTTKTISTPQQEKKFWLLRGQGRPFGFLSRANQPKEESSSFSPDSSHQVLVYNGTRALQVNPYSGAASSLPSLVLTTSAAMILGLLAIFNY